MKTVIAAATLTIALNLVSFTSQASEVTEVQPVAVKTEVTSQSVNQAVSAATHTVVKANQAQHKADLSLAMQQWMAEIRLNEQMAIKADTRIATRDEE